MFFLLILLDRKWPIWPFDPKCLQLYFVEVSPAPMSTHQIPRENDRRRSSKRWQRGPVHDSAIIHLPRSAETFRAILGAGGGIFFSNPPDGPRRRVGTHVGNDQSFEISSCLSRYVAPSLYLRRTYANVSLQHYYFMAPVVNI